MSTSIIEMLDRLNLLWLPAVRGLMFMLCLTTGFVRGTGLKISAFCLDLEVLILGPDFYLFFFKDNSVFIVNAFPF